MSRIFIGLVCIIMLLMACNNNQNKSTRQHLKAKKSDSIRKQKAIDSQREAGDRPDSEQESPSFKEVLNETLESYHKIQNIDKLVIDGRDSIQLHAKYYCLHDSALIVPKRYIWGGDKNKDFITHNFATKVIIIKNNDTVLNKVFLKSDFNNVIYDQLKKYAILFDPAYVGYDKVKGEFALCYSISIPLTDVGVPGCLVLGKNGNYRILGEYAKMNAFKK